MAIAGGEGGGALTDPVTIVIALVSLVQLLTTKIDTLWIVLGAAVVPDTAASIGVVSLGPL